MTWIYRDTPRGFEDLSLAEMVSAGLTQVTRGASAEEIQGGVVGASNPKSIIQKLQGITERTCVSLTCHAVLALINISGNDPLGCTAFKQRNPWP